MFEKRLLTLPLTKSFFLFGPRNTGKSTLIRHIFRKEKIFLIDLLNFNQEDRYTRNPDSFAQEVLALSNDVKHVIIDEVQKLPSLLNSIHQLIENTDKIFIMTGSSARKLRYGGANLLAGRAFVYSLHPFTSFEIGEEFTLDHALHWGTLPAIIYKMKTDEEKADFLRAYTQTYLKEEIWLEQYIRKIDPFRKFLEVAAQCNGEILNISNISRDVGVDDKTIKQYFSILEDTLMGFMLEPYQTSLRKRLSLKPKFYFFDTGVCRSLTRMLTVPLRPQSSDYGKAFEHFIILECLRLSSYYYPDYRFSYLRTQNDVEIDLVVERPGEKTLFIEIKSGSDVREEKLSSFIHFTKDIENTECLCISNESLAKKIQHVLVLPWKEALERYFYKKMD
ncbi:MAG: ATP-binding protein [Alphaproteobacteria bacterium]|nr:ATP-binding protein [Alphaproteobacteria bacterium]